MKTGPKSPAKTIVITGVSRGIGRGLALRFAELGCRIAGCGRDLEALKTLKTVLGDRHLVAAVDVRDNAQVEAWAQSILATLGAPDLLINNAALINQPAPLWQVPAADFSELVDVNLKGVAATIRHFVPAMIARGQGVIVNVSSGWGRSTSPNVAPYCATKWGIEGLTGALAQELPAGLAAVAFSPGVVDTEMLRTVNPEMAAAEDLPEVWARRGADFLLGLGAEHNGQSLSIR